MRKVPVFRFGFVIFGAIALSSTAVTAKIITISGTHSIGEIQQKCDAAGGYFSGGLKGGGYGCSTDKTQIICENNGKCKGSVPSAAAPGGDIGTILRGGTHPISGANQGPSGGNKILPPTTTTPSALTKPGLLGGSNGSGSATTTSNKAKLPTSEGGATAK
jgi:hypothetical protein